MYVWIIDLSGARRWNIFWYYLVSANSRFACVLYVGKDGSGLLCTYESRIFPTRLYANVLLMVSMLEAKIERGTNQLCGGLQARIEVRVHAMRTIWDSLKEVEEMGFILVDARNAFNEANRTKCSGKSGIYGPWGQGLHTTATGTTPHCTYIWRIVAKWPSSWSRKESRRGGACYSGLRNLLPPVNMATKTEVPRNFPVLVRRWWSQDGPHSTPSGILW